ncbi:MAG: phosphoribosylamine--glycine ligase [Dehalococcoidia bacterium]|nr:phosphoribosylamine--glycine ligase [Dehalococcoidia bacterium]MDW8119061.1 phosphoribosylamine--glycine ligase [Chloroflexota bacterium]
MRVLVVGSGAREHALAWKLAQSPQVESLFVAPGNAGTAKIATNIPIPATDIEALVQAAHHHRIHLTVVGPELPLAQGIVDRFRQEGLAIFGPTRAAAQIEASKAFAKQLMQRWGIPTAPAQVFTDYQSAIDYVKRQPLPVVVKADGLAAGKGVTVCATFADALDAISRAMRERVFGPAGERILIEHCLVGREVSVFTFTDGQHVSPLVAACDYKRLLDGDQGPNTGGMGSYSPPEFWTPAMAETVRQRILEPVVHALAAEGRPYQGVLYAGLMVTADGPMVLEFNCRLGDPEAQVILPRLQGDLLDILLAVVRTEMHGQKWAWSPDACVGVVAASRGYPGDYSKGYPIRGLEAAEKEALVFHAGTRLILAEGKPTVVTDGGRVLTVAALGPTLAQAREKAYHALAHIHFEGITYRRDIAALPKGGN